MRLWELCETFSKAKATSCADRKRSSGFFSRQWRTMRSRAGDTLASRFGNSGGSSFRMALIVSAGRLALERPLPAEHFVQDRAEGKDVGARVHLLPRTCSGDM